MAMASLPLPDVDSRILQQALTAAAASDREPNPTVRANLEAAALELWRQAHQARRDAMYARAPR
jgi:hypothetical protein